MFVDEEKERYRAEGQSAVCLPLVGKFVIEP